MGKQKNSNAEFVVDSNVHIEVINPQNVITQTVDKHNKATKQLVKGIMRFIQGDFNTSYRRTDSSEIVYRNDAKQYIPCYINVGTGGVTIDEETQLPKYSATNRRTPPIDDDWLEDTNHVRFSDISLSKEVSSTSRYPIGVLTSEESFEYITQVGDIQQIIFSADVSPGYYTKMYGGLDSATGKNVETDIFITEIGLFSSNVPNTEDLLARVIFKTPEQILYVRPQDTIIIRWTISIIALDDYSTVTEDTEVTTEDGDITVASGTVIDDRIPYTGTIDIENGTNNTENEEG